MKSNKTILLLSSFLLLSFIVSAQDFPINEKTGKVSYEGIVQVEGNSATDLYIKANEWFAMRFNSANNVIQMQDKDAGKIIGKGAIEVEKSGYHNGVFDFTIKFTSKEGRFKYVITDIVHDKRGSNLNCSGGGAIENEKPACGSMNMFKKHWNILKTQAHNKLTVLSNDLKNHMSNTNNDDNDDW